MLTRTTAVALLCVSVAVVTAADVKSSLRAGAPDESSLVETDEGAEVQYSQLLPKEGVDKLWGYSTVDNQVVVEGHAHTYTGIVEDSTGAKYNARILTSGGVVVAYRPLGAGAGTSMPITVPGSVTLDHKWVSIQAIGEEKTYSVSSGSDGRSQKRCFKGKRIGGTKAFVGDFMRSMYDCMYYCRYFINNKCCTTNMVTYIAGKRTCLNHKFVMPSCPPSHVIRQYGSRFMCTPSGRCLPGARQVGYGMCERACQAGQTTVVDRSVTACVKTPTCPQGSSVSGIFCKTHDHKFFIPASCTGSDAQAISVYGIPVSACRVSPPQGFTTYNNRGTLVFRATQFSAPCPEGYAAYRGKCYEKA